MGMPETVDVICVCSADGQIRPLRLRVEDEENQLVRVDIAEVVNVRQVDYVGIEAQIFTCRARIGGRMRCFELKYTFRTHSWCICRRMY